MITRTTIGANVTLPCETRGSESGVPVIFLHGITDSWRSFEPVLDVLPASVRALALTLRGHGDASRPPGGYGPSDMAGDVLAFMDAQRLSSAVVVGHSLGSLVARRLAVAQPERVLGLVLVGTFVSLQGHAEVEALVHEVSLCRDPIDRDFVRAFQRRTGGRQVGDAFIERMVDESLKVPAWVWKQAFERVAAEESDLAALAALRMPTLVVWGDEDGIGSRADQLALCSAIDGARLLEYRGAGHSPHWEQPTRFAEDLLAFLYERR